MGKGSYRCKRRRLVFLCGQHQNREAELQTRRPALSITFSGRMKESYGSLQESFDPHGLSFANTGPWGAAEEEEKVSYAEAAAGIRRGGLPHDEGSRKQGKKQSRGSDGSCEFGYHV